MKGKCRNCGADDGLHHYKTNQCPVGGYEAPIDMKQEWMDTTYAEDNSEEMNAMADRITQLEKQVAQLTEKVRYAYVMINALEGV